MASDLERFEEDGEWQIQEPLWDGNDSSDYDIDSPLFRDTHQQDSSPQPLQLRIPSWIAPARAAAAAASACVYLATESSDEDQSSDDDLDIVKEIEFIGHSNEDHDSHRRKRLRRSDCDYQDQVQPKQRDRKNDHVETSSKRYVDSSSEFSDDEFDALPPFELHTSWKQDNKKLCAEKKHANTSCKTKRKKEVWNAKDSEAICVCKSKVHRKHCPKRAKVANSCVKTKLASSSHTSACSQSSGPLAGKVMITSVGKHYHAANSLQIKPTVSQQMNGLYSCGVRQISGSCATVPLSSVSTVSQDSRRKRELGSSVMSKLVTVPNSVYTDVEMRQQLLLVGPQYGVNASFLSSSRSEPKLVISGDAVSINEAVTAAYEKIISLQSKLINQSEVPVIWPVEWEGSFDAASKKAILHTVIPGSQEYTNVLCRCMETIPEIQLMKLERIQNPWLWKQYALHRTRMSEKGNQALNELDLFHGPRRVNPKLIYDSEEGFDMRFSSLGAWGIGCYFAVNASYSAGDSVLSPQNQDLRMPPVKKGQTRYDTVTGISGDSQIFVTYKNDKAYPFYLITFCINPQ
ncbi:uncharacterized protein LOC134194026 isoform X2 [Corticium candelabrum]|uniref:uncharacterized protein LOC134194026 isoform X2 n=1 Tax=Corticium candelabrum TaxID=121492 RepID=UPI002E258BC0|nr:uncharacterized protein LOC134194026 isoform X2 [Corticium candelabrum]